jgi:WWE domain
MKKLQTPKMISRKTVLNFPGLDYESFEDACVAAADTGRKILLLENVTLSDSFRLRHHQCLDIEGIDPPDNGASDEIDVLSWQHKRTISGSVHSLFVLNNWSKLKLKNVTLLHTKASDDHREVGAAVNLRKKSELTMEHCFIVSHSGFCCWAVQKSNMDLAHCHLEARTRSAIVCFGQPKCRLFDCTISDAGVHAVCARGPCQVELDGCLLQRSAVRALYAYADACVTMNDCHVTGTARSDHAAVEISALQSEEPQSEKKSNSIGTSFVMRRCRVFKNSGVGVCLRGPVRHRMEENDLTENGGDNLEFAVEKKASTVGIVPGQRDSSGSSYRMGDWWCPICTPKVAIMFSLSKCPCCNSCISTGSLLTAEEVSRCNRQQGPVSHATDSESASSAPRWWYDGDSAEKGWMPYDEESSQILEAAFQRCARRDCNLNDTAPKDNGVVLLSGGKYQVNVITKVQTNVETQFPRLVRRISN